MSKKKIYCNHDAVACAVLINSNPTKYNTQIKYVTIGLNIQFSFQILSLII